MHADITTGATSDFANWRERDGKKNKFKTSG